jgi:hypothetical protein
LDRSSKLSANLNDDQPGGSIVPGTVSRDGYWVWNGKRWILATQAFLSPDRAYVWDGIQWIPNVAGWGVSAATAAGRLLHDTDSVAPDLWAAPDGRSIFLSARATIGFGLAAVVGVALIFTFAGRVLPVFFGIHGGAGVYLVLTATGVLITSAVSALGLVYHGRVSVRWRPDSVAFTNVFAMKRLTRLQDLARAVLVPVRLRWWVFSLDFKYALLIGRSQICLHVIDAGEWSDSFNAQLMDRLRLSGVPVDGDWGGKPIDLFGPNGLGARYPGATRLRYAPYSLLAAAAAFLIFGAGLLTALPFALGPTH